jgi:hypothetical protein
MSAYHRAILEGAYAAYSQLFVAGTYPTLDGLRNALDVHRHGTRVRPKPRPKISPTYALSINSATAVFSTNSTDASRRFCRSDPSTS